ncbi:MAG: chromosome segregation protein SMC [bacterium]|nr:chromosome segregation protein SMC [bacterium]
MYLQALTLKGFKSFADTTTIDFAPGLSVIVGPNGSGKSNIVDAISWVLGSQSPTALRSQQMDDVIFAGNPGRSALGRAEVTLTFDNADRRLPLELDEVAISRTLFRSGDSAYAINATQARLIDIAEMLSAAGVGRHRHVIVSQGHIDAVLQAKPAERRAILEEAAGVSAYRVRKEKALRRLEDTEANLARLGDQLNEVRRALRPLERQASVARRHGALAAELTALQIHRLGAELAELRERRRLAATERRDLADRRAATTRELAALDGRIAEAETRLSAPGHVALATASERLAALEELLGEAQRAIGRRQQDYERRRHGALAGDLLASLADESARIEVSLGELDTSGTELAAERDRLEAAASLLAADAQAHAARTEASGAAGDRAAAAQLRGRLGALGDVADRAEAEVAELAGRADRLAERRAAAEESSGRAEQELAACRAEEEAAAAALQATEQRRAEAAAAESAAREERAAADGEQSRWRARVEALDLAMGDVRARSGMEVLTGSTGVLGALGDLVAVEEGWEAAFEAAAGDALAAAVLDGPAAARPALEALVRAKAAGAVLPIRAADGPPRAGRPLRPHVHGKQAATDEVLDGLIGAVVVVPSWQEACDAVAEHPGATVVTPAGDCFSPTGWRVGVHRSGATGEALAESRERLESAEVSLAEADRILGEASAVAASAESVHAAAAETCRTAGQRLADAGRRAADAARHAGAVASDADGAAERLQELTERARAHRRQADEAAGRLAELQRSVEASEAVAHEAAAGLQRRRSDLDAERRSLDRRESEIEARRAVLAERRDEIRARLGGHEAAVASAGVDARRSAVLAESAERLAHSAGECRRGLERLRARQRQLAEAGRVTAARLDGDRRRRAELAASVAEIGELLLGAQRTEDEVRLRIESVVETLHSRHDCDEVQAMGAAQPDLPEGVSAAERIRELEGLLRGIGPVNPLAVQEHDSLRQRHDDLAAQIEDVRSARRDLTTLVRSVDSEILEAFSRCYREVAESFETVFGVLFDGGAGRLTLTDPHDPLASGVEIEAQPAGKSLRRLALLSGGERSLAALAFLFAVFRSQGSPFYVLDEVDAALDDLNLHRFLRLLEEFRSSAQLILVTHQKPTMEIADSLYGVTMRPGGASLVIAERRGAARSLQSAGAGVVPRD